MLQMFIRISITVLVILIFSCIETHIKTTKDDLFFNESIPSYQLNSVWLKRKPLFTKETKQGESEGENKSNNVEGENEQGNKQVEVVEELIEDKAKGKVG